MRSAPAVAPGTWSAVPARSTVAFALDRRPSGTLRGRFEDFVAHLVVGRDGAPTLVGMVRTGSLVVEGREPAARIASAVDALDASRFPRMTFRSSGMDVADGFVEVDGRLTVKDTTLAVTAAGELVPGAGGRPLRLTLETVVDRRQFGVRPAGPSAGLAGHAYETRLHVELALRRMWVP